MAASVLAALPTRSLAQGAEARTVTVLTRNRPELDALGIRVGGFTLFSSLELHETYHDNIFATGAAGPIVSDFITSIIPELRIRSDWSRHYLAVFGSVDYRLHASNSAENFLDWRVGGEGRLDVRRDTHFGGGLEVLRRHESRASANDPRGVEPVGYYLFKPRANYLRRWNRLSMKFDGSINYFGYSDSTDASNNLRRNDGRDRWEYRTVSRFGYEILESYEAFAKFNYGLTDYVLAIGPNSGLNRDSFNYGYSGGIRVDLTGVMFGDFFAGQIFHEYDDAALSDITEYNYGARLTWNMSRLSTLTFGTEQAVNETTVFGASASFDTIYRGSLDHELLRNMIVSLKVNHTKSEYPGESSGRVDNMLNIGASSKYMLNRNLYITFGYDRSDRDSTVGDFDFVSNSYMVRVRIQK